MKVERLYGDIDGVPYSFTRCHEGWRVTCLETRQARFKRCYIVTVKLDGTPENCSCPSYHWNRNPTGKTWCKHMRRLHELLRENFENLEVQLGK